MAGSLYSFQSPTRRIQIWGTASLTARDNFFEIVPQIRHAHRGRKLLSRGANRSTSRNSVTRGFLLTATLLRRVRDPSVQAVSQSYDTA